MAKPKRVVFVVCFLTISFLSGTPWIRAQETEATSQDTPTQPAETPQGRRQRGERQ